MKSTVKLKKTTRGKTAGLTLRLQWNSADPELSEKIWSHIGALLRETLDESQRAEFIEKLAAERERISAVQ